MKAPEEIFIDEVHEVHVKLGDKAAKLFMTEAIKKFVLNCLMKYSDRPSLEKLYKEMQERMAYLTEDKEDTEESRGRILELTLAIVRVQQLLLEDIKHPH